MFVSFFTGQGMEHRALNMLGTLVLYNGGKIPHPKQLFYLESSKCSLNVGLDCCLTVHSTKARAQHGAAPTVGTQLTALSLSVEGHVPLRTS